MCRPVRPCVGSFGAGRAVDGLRGIKRNLSWFEGNLKERVSKDFQKAFKSVFFMPQTWGFPCLEMRKSGAKPTAKSACRLKRGIKRAARFPQIPAVRGFSKALGWHQKRGAGISQGTASQADRKISGKTKDFPAFSRGIKTGVKPISNDILKYF